MLLSGVVRPDLPLLAVALPEEAEHLDSPFPVLLTGVGKVCAAMSVTRALAAGPLPKEIINLGTAGALHPGLSGIHLISRVVQHDFDSATIAALTGQVFGAPIDLADEGPVLATGDVFVADPDLREALARTAGLVDMEAYAVVAAAAAFGVPVRVVKHVSDEADGQANVSWSAAVTECSKALGAWLARA
ncbi:nucleosidase [Catellatospora tritici]|uniref:nucleosidase n=1 Tax=Catellatospora tritici TaxID=2851566 RepID=UPI001C2CD63C|nr:nucleosidase [Catellatospora tritici]MBV1849445.1 nucleoside phosphorylase [Catellatospora tritici]MBV1854017.1 nucleoside phosphorylase [Catellatospora tritici]